MQLSRTVPLSARPFQLAVFAALRLYFAESTVDARGAVFVFLFYALQSTVMVVAGIIPLYALRLRTGDPGLAAGGVGSAAALSRSFSRLLKAPPRSRRRPHRHRRRPRRRRDPRAAACIPG
jgi:hypothetical protein